MCAMDATIIEEILHGDIERVSSLEQIAAKRFGAAQEDSGLQLTRNLSHYLGAGATVRYPDAELEVASVPAWQGLHSADYHEYHELARKKELKELAERGRMTEEQLRRKDMLDSWTVAGPPPSKEHEDMLRVQLKTCDGVELLHVRPTDNVYRTVKAQLALRRRRKWQPTLELMHGGELIEDNGLSFEDWDIVEDGATITVGLDDRKSAKDLCRQHGVLHLDELKFKTGRSLLLHYASKLPKMFVSEGHPVWNTIIELIDAQADINMQDRHGNTALHYAVGCRSEHSPMMVQAMLDAGAKPEIQNRAGEAPIDYYVPLSALRWESERKRAIDRMLG